MAMYIDPKVMLGQQLLRPMYICIHVHIYLYTYIYICSPPPLRHAKMHIARLSITVIRQRLRKSKSPKKQMQDSVDVKSFGFLDPEPPRPQTTMARRASFQ